MNREQALTWLEVCISNEELQEEKMIAYTLYKDLVHKDEIIEDCYFRKTVLKQLRTYVNENLK